MTFAELCKLGREARERTLSAIDYSKGLPRRGKCGSRYQTEILAKAMAQHVIRYGPITIEGFTIGISPVVSGSAILRATDGARLAGMLQRLYRAVMPGFEEDMAKRWEAFKIRRGDIAPRSDKSDAERFSNNTFRGFD